jgi:hypothetical protein
MPQLFASQRNGVIALCALGTLLLGNLVVHCLDYRDISTRETVVLVYASVAPLVFGVILWCLSEIKSVQSAFLFWLLSAGFYVAMVVGNLYVLVQIAANA